MTDALTSGRVRSRIQQGAEQMSMSLGEDQLDRLCQYLQLLEKWNKAYNLTAIRDPEEMAALHILDSLIVLRFLENKKLRLLDVGTGAGLPGAIIALLLPEIECTLLDSNGKKCRFLNQVKAEMSVANMEVANTRVEKFEPEQGFDAIFSRAFATLKDMTDNAAHLLATEGRFWAMKGKYPEAEIEELAAGFKVEAVHELQVPFVDAERHLVEIRKL